MKTYNEAIGRGKKIVVFGCGGLAEVMQTHLQELGLPVHAFAVESAHIPNQPLLGNVPIVSWENLPLTHKQNEVSLLIPLGWHGMNAVRQRIYRQAQAWGYSLPGFRSPAAFVSTDCVDNINLIIHAQSQVGPKTRLGENVYISACSHISHHCTVEDHVFVAPGVQVGGYAHIETSAVIGMGAIIRSGVRVGQGAFVGMGAVVTRDVEPSAVVAGHPAARMNMTPMQAAKDRSKKA